MDILVVLLGAGTLASIVAYVCTYTRGDTTQVVTPTRVEERSDGGYADAARYIARWQMTDPWCITHSCQRSAELERRSGEDRRATHRGGHDRRRDA